MLVFHKSKKFSNKKIIIYQIIIGDVAQKLAIGYARWKISTPGTTNKKMYAVIIYVINAKKSIDFLIFQSFII